MNDKLFKIIVTTKEKKRTLQGKFCANSFFQVKDIDDSDGYVNKQ